MSQPTTAPPLPPQEPDGQQPLRRAPRSKMVAGVCGGLGRHCDVDPVIFRIVVAVLSATGGVGLIFYGFAWLLVPADDEDENEFRRMLTGRVDRAALSAVLLALLGSGLLLTTLSNADMLAFASMLSLAGAGVAVWSLRRRAASPDGAPLDPVTAQTVAEAPPETKAPPSPDAPSWWRDPILKDGTTGPVAAGYLWGPEDAVASGPGARDRGRRPAAPAQPWGRRGIGGAVVALAIVAGAVGTVASWDGRPLGASLQIGLVAALAVLGAGLVVSSVVGRTGFGTVLLTTVTACLLAGASALPENISTTFGERTWRPASAAALAPSHELGSGSATLDLGAVEVPPGTTVSTRAEVGLGLLRVVVPRDATVVLDAEVGFGDVRLPPGTAGGAAGPDLTVRETLAPPKGAEPAGTLELKLDVSFGQVEVDRVAP